jgi:phospholipid/cholesterol/gamma-HCH transport system substrate-binding protein
VHLVSTKNKLETDNEIFDQLENIEEFNANGVYSYLIGASNIYSEIETLHQSLRFDFPESSIVAFKNGKLIKLEKALKSLR